MEFTCTVFVLDKVLYHEKVKQDFFGIAIKKKYIAFCDGNTLNSNTGQNITGETIFFRNHAENMTGRLVQTLFCFSRNLYMK